MLNTIIKTITAAIRNKLAVGSWQLAICITLLTANCLLQTASFSQQVTFTSVIPDSLGINVAMGSINTCFADINSDCYLDIWAGGYGWLNDGTGHFTQLTNPVVNTGVMCFGDYDNDGYPDAVSAQGEQMHLYKNQGPPTYFLKNVDTLAGVDSTYTGRNLLDAAWLDYDNDGWIDFYVSSYENPMGVGHPDYLFRNNGNGTFTDVSAAAGISGQALCSRGITIFDYNNDGLQDIFVSVYRLQRNLLWQNNGNGTFSNVAAAKGVQGLYLQGYYGHNIGTAAGDYNNDGYMDLFSPITHHAGYPGDNTNHLWKNNGPGNYNFFDFKNAGTYNAEIGSAPFGVDYDNDGDLDLFYTNLYGTPGARFWLYRNDSNNTFTQITSQAGFPTSSCSGTSSTEIGLFADLNYDGFPDAFIPVCYVPKFYMSNANNSNRWLNVKLTGSATSANTNDSTTNAMGIGAKVTCYTSSRKVVRENTPHSGNGYGSMYVPFLYFGLGSDTLIDSLEIYWPSGHTERFYSVAVNQRMCINEYTGTTVDVHTMDSEKQNIKVYPNPSNGKFQIQVDSKQSTIDKWEVIIYNVMGEKVYEAPALKGVKEIDVLLPSGTGQGIYFINIKTENESIVKKLIINK